MAAEVMEFDSGPSGVVRRWRAELRRAEKEESKWREKARKIVKRYRDEEERTDKRYNILWANTETLRPQMYSDSPEPVVQRRYLDQDPVGKYTAQMLQRGLEYAIDAYDFDGTINQCITDYLLPGRAVARVRYVPTWQDGERSKVTVFEEPDGEGGVLLMADMDGGPMEVPPERIERGEDGVPYTLGEPEQELAYEEVRCEYVNWEDYRQSPARTWAEVRWVAYRHRMTREEQREAFGRRAARDIPLDFAAEGGSDTGEESDQQHIEKRATVWEIWDRDAREVIFIAEGKADAPIEVRDDPLNLEGFFPQPEPLYSVKTNNTMVPVPEYTLYQDQALELNVITSRIDRLVSALRARGLYAGEHKDELNRLMDGDDNELIPVEDFGSLQGGKLEDKIAWMPIEQIAKTLQWLYQQRDQLLSAIYQLTGIADIMRGSTNAQEGVGTQQLKSRFGVMRLQPRQRRVQKFVRDLLELKAEIMAEMFDPETLQLMTGMQIAPQMIELMRNDRLRGFRVDIETDSTIAADEQADKQEVTEMFQALSGFVQNLVPAVQGGMFPKEAAKEIILFGMRRFRVSRQVEEAMEQDVQPQPPQPDPIEMARLQNERMKIAQDAQNKAMDRQIKVAELRQKASEADDENQRHYIDALLKQAEQDDRVFQAAMQQIGSLTVVGDGVDGGGGGQ